MSESEHPKLRISYRRSASCRQSPISGAWGGTTPQGDVLVGLYQEYVSEPAPYLHDQETGKEEPLDTPEFIEISREIQMLCVMRTSVAKSIGKWLIDSAETAETAIRSRSKSK